MKLTKTEIAFLKKFANKITTPTGEDYYYIPCWFKNGNGEGRYDMLSFVQLPQDFKTYVTELRGKK